MLFYTKFLTGFIIFPIKKLTFNKVHYTIFKFIAYYIVIAPPTSSSHKTNLHSMRIGDLPQKNAPFYTPTARVLNASSAIFLDFNLVI